MYRLFFFRRKFEIIINKLLNRFKQILIRFIKFKRFDSIQFILKRSEFKGAFIINDVTQNVKWVTFMSLLVQLDKCDF